MKKDRIDTVRLKLLKIAARIVCSARYILFKLCARHFSGVTIFSFIYVAVRIVHELFRIIKFFADMLNGSFTAVLNNTTYIGLKRPSARSFKATVTDFKGHRHGAEGQYELSISIADIE